jgi:hypothetical protein
MVASEKALGLFDWLSIVHKHSSILGSARSTAGVVRHHRRHHRARRDVDRDRIARMIARKQGGRDQRRRSVGDDRCKTALNSEL